MSHNSFLLEYALPLLLAAIVCGAFASQIAEEKGYSSMVWFLAGLLFPVVGLIAAAGLPDRKGRGLLLNALAKLKSDNIAAVSVEGYIPEQAKELDDAAIEKRAREQRNQIVTMVIIGALASIGLLVYLTSGVD